MKPNINPETGVPYGIITLLRLDPDIIEILLYGQQAKDLSYEQAKEQYLLERQRDWDAGLLCGEFDEQAAVDTFNDQYNNDEPVIGGEYQGVTYQTTWLGGAQLLFVFHSPFIRKCRPCSLCVPNAGDLATEGGYAAYDVAPDWRYK